MVTVACSGAASYYYVSASTTCGPYTRSIGRTSDVSFCLLLPRARVSSFKLARSGSGSGPLKDEGPRGDVERALYGDDLQRGGLGG